MRLGENGEQKLLEELACLRQTTEAAMDAIVQMDQKGQIIYWNPAAELIFGYSCEEIIGQELHTILAPERYHQQYFDGLTKFLNYGQGLSIGRTIELFALNKNGHEFPVELSLSAFRSKGSWLFTGIIRNIAKRKKMEEELLKIRKLESIGILAGGIAHDFNNILTIIMGNISLAKMKFTSGEGEKSLSSLADAEKACRQAKELTLQLLTFAKGGAPIIKNSSINDFLKETVVFVLRGSSVGCRFEVPENLWGVKIDESQISQVINNIIINAVQAMPDGGFIQVKVSNINIEENLSLPLAAGKYVEIQIKDEGTGISFEYLDKIFDPYFTTKTGSNGLGLASAFSIIKKHYGYLTVKSESGRGATFFIYLPADGEESTLEEPLTIKKDTIQGFTGKNKILVVDDEEMLRQLLKEMLEHLGYEPWLAKDGVEAVDIFKEALEDGEPFQGVILDLTIPGGMGGKETIKKLKELDPQISAIVSSGYCNDPVMANYQCCGFSGVVTKPYNVEELARVLREII